MRNFFSNRQGQAVSRAGTVFCGEVKSSAAKVRLIPFVYSDSQAFVLEFGNAYIRVWQNGSYLGEISSGSGFANFVVPYLTAELPKLKYAQVGGVMTLAHGNHAPAELTWNGSTWSYAVLSFDRPTGTLTAYALAPLNSGTPTLSTVQPWVATTGYGTDEYVTYKGLIYRSIHYGQTGNIPDDPGSAFWVQDDVNPGREWQYVVTDLLLDAQGQPYETASVALQQIIVPDQPWDSRITYRFGTRITSSGVDTGTGLTDDGSGSGAFYVSVIHGPNRGNLLSVGAAWVSGGGSLGPQIDPLPTRFVVSPDRPVIINLATAYTHALTDPSFIGNRVYRGLGGTYGWVGDVKLASGGTFTDTGIEPDWTTQPPQGRNPFKVFNSSGSLVRTENPSVVTFFEQRRLFGRSDQRLGYIWASVIGDYANFDKHFLPTETECVELELATRKLEEIRWMLNVGPSLVVGTQSGVWVVGGSSGPMTPTDINAKKQIEVGTSWLDAIVIEGAALFVRTKGTGVRSIFHDIRVQGAASQDMSIFASHLFIGHQVVDWAYAEDPWSVIWAVREDGLALSLTYVREQDIWAWAWHDTPGAGGLYENVCSVPEGLEDAVYFIVNRTIGGVTKRYLERQSTRVINATNINHAVCLDCAGIYSGTPIKHITGLSFLEGKAVNVLADGNVLGPYTVTSGAIDLEVAASYVVAGLAYMPELEQLDLSVNTTEAKTREKQVVRVGIELDNSRGVQVGPDFEHLVELKQRTVADGFGTVPLGTGLYLMNILGKWSLSGRVAIRQVQPLPLTVVAITREVEFGDP